MLLREALSLINLDEPSSDLALIKYRFSLLLNECEKDTNNTYNGCKLADNVPFFNLYKRKMMGFRSWYRDEKPKLLESPTEEEFAKFKKLIEHAKKIVLQEIPEDETDEEDNPVFQKLRVRISGFWPIYHHWQAEKTTSIMNNADDNLTHGKNFNRKFRIILF